LTLARPIIVSGSLHVYVNTSAGELVAGASSILQACTLHGLDFDEGLQLICWNCFPALSRQVIVMGQGWQEYDLLRRYGQDSDAGFPIWVGWGT